MSKEKVKTIFCEKKGLEKLVKSRYLECDKIHSTISFYYISVTLKTMAKVVTQNGYKKVHTVLYKYNEKHLNHLNRHGKGETSIKLH